MPNEFNADDILEMAVMIERNGAIFYRDAAKIVDDDKQKKFLSDLAAMEDDHEKTFSDMRKDLEKEETFLTTFDPESENAQYLKALADSRVFTDTKKTGTTMKEILGSAIQAEKDSIAFYLGMKELIPEKYGKSKIDDIIKEEMSHIRILASKLKEYN